VLFTRIAQASSVRAPLLPKTPPRRPTMGHNPDHPEKSRASSAHHTSRSGLPQSPRLVEARLPIHRLNVGLRIDTRGASLRTIAHRQRPSRKELDEVFRLETERRDRQRLGGTASESLVPSNAAEPLRAGPEASCGNGGSRRMGKWKTKSRFPTFPPPRIPLSRGSKTRAGFALRPTADASCRPYSQKSSCR